MCWFKKKPVIVPPEPPVIVPPPEPTLTLPHPEEPPDYSKTVDNTDIDTVIDSWLIDYKVPETEYSYWRNMIVIGLDPNLPYPACAFEKDSRRHLIIRPDFLNPGVIAHEQAHNSYALLTESQKTEFGNLLFELENTDPYIVLLWKTKRPGWGDYVIEAHAEIYRYIGEKMPEQMKAYYPKLF